MTRILILIQLLIFGSLAFFLPTHPSIQAAEKDKSRKIFLTIGISKFADPRWPKLNYTSKDAKDMGSYLQRQFDYGIQLDESKFPNGVQLSDVRNNLAQIEQENQNEDDTVLVYISTHGTLGREARNSGSLKIQKYLVTADTAFDQVVNTSLSFRELTTWFKSLKSRRKALIIDSCYSGGGKAQLNAAMLGFLAQQKAGSLKEPDEDQVEGTGIYAASAWGEEAREDSKLNNGVYTHFLLKAFEEDPNNDGATQLSEAHAMASNWVINYTQGEQHPSAQLEFVGRDPIIIRGEVRRGALPYIIALQKDLRAYLLQLNGKSVGSFSKGILEVPVGSAHLELIDPSNRKVIASRSVELFEHETYTLESLLFEKKVNHIEAGISQFRFASALGRSRISSEPIHAWQLAFRRDGLWETLDGLARLSRLQSTSSEVDIDERIGEGPIETYHEKQRIQGWKFDLMLQKKHRITWLTPLRQDWTTSFVFGSGPSWLQLQRVLPDWGNPQNVDKTASSAGVAATLGLEGLVPIRNLHVGFNTNYQIYADLFTGKGQLIDIWSLDINFGLAF